MEIAGKKVLVTGAGGFIASHLCEQLVREGCKVRAMLHYDSRAHRGNLEYVEADCLRQMEIISGDVRDAHFMMHAVADCDVVFHLAALIAIPYSYVAPTSYLETNAIGTLNVLEACRHAHTPRIIHTSTSECYGTALYKPIDEKHPLQGQSPYSASKIAADKVAESYYLSFELPVVTVRPFNTFGPRQSARAVIPTILSQLLAGNETLKLGSTTPVRDFNYVTNTADAFIAAARSDLVIGEVVNAGFGEGITIGALAELAMEVTGRKARVVTDDNRVRPEKSEVGLLLCDWSKAQRLMGWSPRIKFKEGLTRTAEFVQRNLALYRPEEYTR